MAEEKTSQVLEVPEPPAGTPEAIRAEWKRVYGEALERCLAPAIKEFSDSSSFEDALRAEGRKGQKPPFDPSIPWESRTLDPKERERRAAWSLNHLSASAVGNAHNATRMEANKLLKVPPPANYAEALALADWQALVREEREVVEKGATIRKLVGVTIEGAKFSFPVPAEKAAAAN